MADVLCVTREVRIKEKLAASRLEKTRLLAANVSDRGGFREAQGLGFDLFQGAFFKKPEGVRVRRLTSHQISRFRLLRLMQQEDPDFSQIAESVEADAALSYRLLGYMNSAAFGFRQTIKSIRQAITLLGWIKVRNWLHVALLSDMAQGPGSTELVILAAQRGKFLELIGTAFDYWGFEADSLQLLGLFSLLDVMLDLPAEEYLLYLPLEESLKAALRREPQNEYLPLLQLVELLEESRWNEVSRLVQRLGLAENAVMEQFQTSITWADQFWSA
jgi:EAL and modified HD-GYP domain-containing signal transduction protein